MTRYLQQQTLYPPLLPAHRSAGPGIIVVIPAYNEPHLVGSLESLNKCFIPDCAVEIIVVFNSAKGEDPEIVDQNRLSERLVKNWARTHQRNGLSFHTLLLEGLPAKHAGVGLARKIGMDEACWRFEKAGNGRGIIACFDADSRCDEDYLIQLYRHFVDHPSCLACSIYYEHPLHGPEFEPKVYEAIAAYELHLRYYIQAQRYAGFPWAYHTIGSAMAVRCDAYQQQGGMNRRKAGEDFYFLHKFSEIDGLLELNTTRVLPSPRPSDRVPFGTGKAVGNILQYDTPYKSYSLQSFMDLKVLLNTVDQFFEVDRWNEVKHTLPVCIQVFCEEQDFSSHLQAMRAHVASLPSFRKRFFRWFNAFLLMKYVHFARDRFYPDQPVEQMAAALLVVLACKIPDHNTKDLLQQYRRMQRS